MRTAHLLTKFATLSVVVGLSLAGSPSIALAAADATAPTLSAFTRAGNAGVDAPTTINISYTAADNPGGSGLSNVAFTYDRPDGGSFSVSDADVANSGAVAAGSLNQWAAAGAYTLASVSVVDAAGNRTDYFRDGSTLSEPSGVTGTHSLAFAAADLSVNNPGQDISVPELTSVALTSPATTTSGATVRISYNATDAGSDLAAINALVLDSTGDALQLADAAPSTSGTLSGTLSTSQAGGAFHLITVTLTDHAGNTSVYATGGLVSCAPSGATGPSQHTFSFPAVTFSVPAKATALAASLTSTTVTYPATTTLSGRLLRTDLKTGLAGRSLTVQSRPHGASTWARLTAATSAADGGYRLSVRPSGNTDYRVLHAATSAYSASTSSTVTLWVRPLIAASLSSSAVRHGHSVALYGSVGPNRAGQYVTLQRYYSSAWHAVTSVRLDSSSNYAFVITPGTVGKYAYRVYKAAEASHVAGVSATRSLSVT